MLAIFRMTTLTASPWLVLLIATAMISSQPAAAQDRVDRVRQEREARDREADRRMERDRPERREIDDRPRDERFDWQQHEREMQMHRQHMERIATQARVASDEVLTASFALEHLPELVRNPQERREVVTDMLQQTDNPAIKRLLRMKLLEYSLHSDQRDEALEHLRALIVP
ncbi:hypothetical protein [Blastopirellula marina]|uniref:HEAT repeat domain-containing protein n=1 Tax=Blastopirellula marina TaxID=124 RepID=A0A2S8FM70_9BACT|nr:hypothetical protein [Blastopirellula marina]PQO32954.1 hypothetical protein C5Y98_17595 [Blastopirellula marina]PTL43121.1 hypothetical protein C5Y97_17605 [Blastopirellula marina]